MAQKITDARRSLVKAIESTQLKIQELDEERKIHKSSIRSLNAALRALDGGAKRSSPTRVTAKLANDKSSQPKQKDQLPRS